MTTGSPVGYYEDRERILEIGLTGTGKTYDWLQLARWLPNHTFHVLDPDSGVLRVWKNEFPDVKNVKYYLVPNWLKDLQENKPNEWVGGLYKAFKKISSEVKPDDWVVAEHMGVMWEMAQSTFTDEVFGSDIGMYFLAKRKAMQVELDKGSKSDQLAAFDGWKDWSVINKMHNADFLMKLCYELPVHVYMTSSVSVTSQKLAEKEDSEQKRLYKDTLIRIDGQKSIPFKVQSILLKGGNPESGFFMSTFLKDRGRRWVKDVRLVRFPIQYLVNVAGWPANPR